MSDLMWVLGAWAIAGLVYALGVTHAGLRQGRRNLLALDAIDPDDPSFWGKSVVFDLCVSGKVSPSARAEADRERADHLRNTMPRE